MTDPKDRPFLAGQRHDTLELLNSSREELVQRRVVEAVARGLDSARPKLDGKAGAVDGTIGMVLSGASAYSPGFLPICGAYPGPKVKDRKETKDGKEGKEGKEAKDSKEGKEGKESKDSKEGKEGKESKDTKEGNADQGFKVGAAEVQNPFSRVGDPIELPAARFNEIAKLFPATLQAAIQRGARVLF